MKKSLSGILSLAMAFSMFSSVALAADAAKTSADFTDLKDLDAATKAKFDALISAGVFDGVKEGTFGLKDKMNRAQFAKVASLIFGLKVDSTLKTSSFTDVKADDPANGYALPYIEAVKKAGITDGYAPGEFNPAGEVTKEQLAAFLLRGLGKDSAAKAAPGVADKTVSDWAKGYVALALDLKLLSNGADGTFGGTSAATRDLLVVSSYQAKDAAKSINQPEKASVASAKAVGVQKVQVNLDRDVDTTKATLTLKKGTADVPVTVKWADDKKSATLTLTDSKVSAAEYTVTLGGLDAASVDKTTAAFTGEDEVLKSLDFVAANDTIAYATSVVVKLVAKNQYDENASFSSGAYSVFGGYDKKITRNDAGELLLTLDTTLNSSTQGISIIPVTVVNNDFHITVTKNFKLGTQPIFTKMEIGSAQYSNKDKAIKGKGDNAKYELSLYDQYGSLFGYDVLSNIAQSSVPSKTIKQTFSLIWNDYIDSAKVNWDLEDNGNNIPRLVVSLTQDIDKSAEYNFTLTYQAATATGKVAINSSKVATKVQLGDFNDVIAAGDDSVYIPVIAYDVNGDQLSVDDLTNDTNLGRIKLTVSNVASAQIMSYGEHKGQIRLKTVQAASKGAVTVTAYIAEPNATSTVTKTFTVADARYPDRIKEVSPVYKKYVTGGAGNFKYVILDQYGKELDRTADDRYYAVVRLQDTTTVTGGTYWRLSGADATVGSQNVLSGVSVNDAVYRTPGNYVLQYSGSDKTTNYAFKKLNEGFRITALSGAQTAQFNIEIWKVTANGPIKQTSFEQALSVVSNADLTYNIPSSVDAYNTIDSAIALNTPAYNSLEYFSGVAGWRPVALNYSTPDPDNMLGSEIKISATDAAGDAVALKGTTGSANSSNPTVVAAQAGPNSKPYIVGNKVGTASVNVVYTNNKGETKNAIVTVNTKADGININKIFAANSKVTVTAGTYFLADSYYSKDISFYNELGINELGAPAAGATQVLPFTGGLMNLKVFTQYASRPYEYKDIIKYNFALGLSFAVTDIVAKTDANGAPLPNATVAIDQTTGKVTIGTGVAGFVLNAIAPNGKSATTEVEVK